MLEIATDAAGNFYAVYGEPGFSIGKYCKIKNPADAENGLLELGSPRNFDDFYDCGPIRP